MYSMTDLSLLSFLLFTFHPSIAYNHIHWQKLWQTAPVCEVGVAMYILNSGAN